jgi:hypothetical protein
MDHDLGHPIATVMRCRGTRPREGGRRWLATTLGFALMMMAAACAGSSSDAPFPNLSDLPEKPSVTPADQWEHLRDRLLKDRAAGHALAPARKGAAQE